MGDMEVAELTKRDMVNNIGYVAQSPFIFDGTIEENLLYSCAAKAGRNGNVKREDLPSLDEIIEVLQQTGVFVDVLRFGLNTFLTDKATPISSNAWSRSERSSKRSTGTTWPTMSNFSTSTIICTIPAFRKT